MKTKEKFLTGIAILFFLLFSISALADVSVTYNFHDAQGNSIDNVNFLVYDCLDATCANVKTPTFTGSHNYGNSNDSPPNTDLTVIFPTILETRSGYALYYYKEGYLPMEYKANWAGGLGPALAYDINFVKKASCASPIQDFQIINTNDPNLPIQIKIKTQLDATTYSAFSSTSNTPEYVPQQYRDYYSANTRATLKIYNSNNDVVFERTQMLNIYMDSSEDLTFEWVPQTAGTYKAVITTDVVDNQCSSEVQQKAVSQFSVVVNSLDKCYTLINNLRTSVIEPNVNENVQIQANKISNYRGSSGELTPLATNVFLKIYDSANNLVKQESKILVKNSDTLNPMEFSFNWIPTHNGTYKIEMNGIANDPICNGRENLDETETIETIVHGQSGQLFLNLRNIGNKNVNENQDLKFKVSSDYNGNKKLTYNIINMPDGATFNTATNEFSYKPSYDVVDHGLINQGLYLLGIAIHKDFEVTFKVTDGSLTDYQTIKIKVYDSNRKPILNDIENINVNEGSLVKIFAYATDEDNDVLQFLYSGPMNSNGEWQTKLGDRGLYSVRITVRDNFGGETYKTIRINVIGSGDNNNNITVYSGYTHDLKTKSLYFEKDTIKAGDTLVVYTKIMNEGTANENNIKLRMTIPELGIINQVTVNNLNKDNQRLKIFYIDIPENTQPGYYVLKSWIANYRSEETEAIEFKVV